MAAMTDWGSLWQLDEAKRLEALSSFVYSLETTFRASTSAASSLDTLHPDLAYALKRLIRGLSSSREAARIGFAVGLTELLARLSDLPLGPVLALLLDNTEVTGSTKGEEGRDRHFGRLVGIEALIAAGLLSQATVEDVKAVCGALLGLYDAKSYLKESAGLLLVDMVRALDGDKEKIAAAKALLLAATRVQTPESIAWSVVLGADVFAEGRTDVLIKTLKATHSIKSIDGQPHFVWQVLATASPSASTIEALTEQLLTRDASHTQRREGLLGLSVLLRSSEQLSQATFQLAVESSAKGRSSAPGISMAAKKLLSRFVELLKTAPATALPTLLRLVGSDGAGYFTALSQSKVIDEIVGIMPAEDQISWLATLRTILVSPPQSSVDEEEADDKSVTQLRRWAIEQIASVGSGEALSTLCVHGFFRVVKESKKATIEAARKVPSPALPIALQELCRSRLYTSLGKDLSSLPACLDTLNALSQDTKHVVALFITDEATAELRSSALKLAAKLSKGEEREKALAQLLQCVTLVSFEDLAIAPALDAIVELATQPEADSELVAQLLVLLQQPQALLRQVVEETFKVFAASMGGESVDMLIEMVAPEVLDDEEEDDAMPDVQTTKGVNGDADSSEESEDEEDEVSIGSDEELTLDMGEVNVELRDKVEAALREANLAPGEDDESEEEEEELLDDDAMVALDEQLAAAFRSESKRPSKKALKLQDTNARLKVLDLLQLLVKSAPASPVLPRIIATLHAAVSDADLSAKATRLLASVLSTKIKAGDVTEQLAAASATQLERMLARRSNKGTASASAFLLRLLPSDEAAQAALQPAVEAFTTSKSPPFTEHVLLALVKARPAAFVSSLPVFADSASTADVRPMRKRQLARTSALLCQALASHAPAAVWTALPNVLAALSSSVDAAGPADTAREQLKVLAATLRLARNPAKLAPGSADVAATCAKAQLAPETLEEGAFGGSKPCLALAKEVQQLASGTVAVNAKKRKREAGETPKKKKSKQQVIVGE